MITKTNTKTLMLLTAGLFVWLAGIILTPLLAATEISWLKRVAAFGYIFYAPVCHQISERSFALAGFPLTVCVRCFSVYLAGFLLYLTMLKNRLIRFWPLSAYFLLIMPALADFLLEKIFLYQTITGIRFISGFLAGIALFHLLLVSLSSSEVERADPLLHKN